MELADCVWPMFRVPRDAGAAQTLDTVVRAHSHPFAQTPSTLRWVAVHPVMAQVPDEHVVAATLDEQMDAQLFPQEPQLFRLLVRFTSQPSPAALLQFPKPALQAAIAHMPAAHIGVPLGAKHGMPQPPQLATEVRVLISQPSMGLLLQSAKPALQVPTVHAPLVQLAVAFGTLQVRPHMPQWVGMWSC